MAAQTLPVARVTELSESELTRAELLALRAIGYQPVTLRARLVTDHGRLQVAGPETQWRTLDLVARTYR